MSFSDQQAAQALAQDRIVALAAAVDDDFAILEGETVETGRGWVFFYNSREYVESGDPMSSLAGNGPILVTRDGVVHELSSATDWKDAIEAI